MMTPRSSVAEVFLASLRSLQRAFKRFIRDEPRQLRALVTLLVLLPLLPTVFVVRFLIEAIYSEHLESKELIRPVYLQVLESTSTHFAASLLREIPPASGFDHGSASQPPAISREVADAVLQESPQGTLSSWHSPNPSSSDPAADRLVKAVTVSGGRYAAAPTTGPVRWRFLTDNPESIFALRPSGKLASGSSSVIFIKTRRHLLEMISAYYSKALDAQTSLRVIDENGETLTITGPSDSGAADTLAEMMLPPPLPPWRVQVSSTDTTFIDGIAHDQVRFSIWQWVEWSL